MRQLLTTKATETGNRSGIEVLITCFQRFLVLFILHISYGMARQPVKLAGKFMTKLCVKTYCLSLYLRAYQLVSPSVALKHGYRDL